MIKHTTIQQDLPNDEQIIELYWQRNETAIQETDTKYGRFLFKIAYNILYDSYDCEQCQSDAYLGIWNAIPPARPTVFPAFIAQIMRCIAINLYREKRAKKNIPSEFTVSMEDLYETLKSNESIEADVEAKEIGRLINNFVRGLSKQNRYIFVGRFYMADSVDQIAQELNLTPSSVYKALSRIKLGLKDYLERNGVIV